MRIQLTTQRVDTWAGLAEFDVVSDLGVSPVAHRQGIDGLDKRCADASKIDAGKKYNPLFVSEEDWERYKPKSFQMAIDAFQS